MDRDMETARGCVAGESANAATESTKVLLTVSSQHRHNDLCLQYKLAAFETIVNYADALVALGQIKKSAVPRWGQVSIPTPVPVPAQAPPEIHVLSDEEVVEVDDSIDREVVGQKRALGDSPSKVEKPSKKSRRGKAREPGIGRMQPSSRWPRRTPEQVPGPSIDLSGHEFEENGKSNVAMLPNVGTVVCEVVPMSRRRTDGRCVRLGVRSLQRAEAEAIWVCPNSDSGQSPDCQGPLSQLSRVRPWMLSRAERRRYQRTAHSHSDAGVCPTKGGRDEGQKDSPGSEDSSRRTRNLCGVRIGTVEARSEHSRDSVSTLEVGGGEEATGRDRRSHWVDESASDGRHAVPGVERSVWTSRGAGPGSLRFY